MQFLEGVLELLKLDALPEQRLQVQPAGLEERGHLHPGFVHAAAVDSLHRGTLEDDIVDQVERYVLGRNAQQRSAAAGAQRLEPLLDGAGVTAHFEQHIHPRTGGLAEDPAWSVFRGGIDDHIRAHAPGHAAAVFIGFRREYGRASAGFGHGNGHEADRTAAGHQYRLPGDLPGQHGVYGVAERIENGTVAFRNSRIQPDDVGGGNSDQLGKRAVLIDTDDFDVRTDVRFAHAALMAMAAVHVHFGADKVPGFQSADFAADLFDDAAEFVAEGHRRFDPRLRPAIPAVDVQVGAANRGGFHAHQHIGRADGGHAGCFQRQPARRLHLA